MTATSSPRLPTEILGQIVAQLAPPSYQLPSATNLSPKAIAAEVPLRRAEYVECRDALRSLCLTSTALREYATPILYSNVWLMPIGCETRLVPVARFLRTLLQRRNLRDIVTELACLVDVSAHCRNSSHNKWQTERDLESVGAWKDIEPQDVRRLSYAHLQWVAGGRIRSIPRGWKGSDRIVSSPPLGVDLLTSVLTFSPNLEKLTVQQLSVQLEQVELESHEHEARDSPHGCLHLMCSAWCDAGKPVPATEQPLAKLHTLQMEPEWEPLLCFCYPYEEHKSSRISIAMFDGFLKTSPNLRIVRAYKDGDGWYSIPKSAVEVSISGDLHTNTLAICSSRGPIEKLEIRPYPFPPAPQVDELSQYPRDMFNDGLEDLASTLRSLTIHTFRNSRLYGGNFGFQNRLTCIQKFDRLEHLSCGANELLGRAEDLDGNSVTDFLPRSLRRLQIMETWWYAIDADDTVQSASWTMRLLRPKLVNLLTEFADQCGPLGKVPKLRTFELTPFSSTIMPHEGTTWADMKPVFARAGVEFTLGKMPPGTWG
jgi:hypothetical protein